VQEIETSLLAVVCARVKREEGGVGGVGAGVSLSIDKAAQLFKLGTAADFGRCKADRKDGKACSMAVNKAVCEYCMYHAAAAAKTMRSGRMELSNGGCAPR
jgi:minichromosome maintenance protein 10